MATTCGIWSRLRDRCVPAPARHRDPSQAACGDRSRRLASAKTCAWPTPPSRCLGRHSSHLADAEAASAAAGRAQIIPLAVSAKVIIGSQKSGCLQGSQLIERTGLLDFLHSHRGLYLTQKGVGTTVETDTRVGRGAIAAGGKEGAGARGAEAKMAIKIGLCKWGRNGLDRFKYLCCCPVKVFGESKRQIYLVRCFLGEGYL